jgi:hypothetical protein
MRDSGYGNSEYELAFKDHCRFISNYMSIQVRKLKFETDGTYNMIGIKLILNPGFLCKIIPEYSLNVLLTSFNKESYNLMCEIEKYEYYLSLLEEGYRIAAQYKDIPLDDLLRLHQQFRDGDYKNEWQHKRKVCKELGIDIVLNCYFRSINFQLEMVVSDRKTKKEVVKGIVLTTPPNEVCFDYKFRDIIIGSEYLIITDFFNECRFRFLISDILQGIFKVEEFGYDINKKEYVRIDRENDSKGWTLPT